MQMKVAADLHRVEGCRVDLVSCRGQHALQRHVRRTVHLQQISALTPSDKIGVRSLTLIQNTKRVTSSMVLNIV